MSKFIELNNIHFTRSDDGKGKISAYVALYYDGTPATEYQMSQHKVERIRRGAMSKVIADPEIELWYNHDGNTVLGRNSEHFFLREDTKGIKLEAEIDDDPDWTKVLAKITKKIIRGTSFDADGDASKSYENGTFVQWIEHVDRVKEFSFVNRPAYKGTGKTIMVRSESGIEIPEDKNMEETIKRLERVKNLISDRK